MAVRPKIYDTVTVNLLVMNLLPEGTMYIGYYLPKKVPERCEKFEMLHYFVRPIAGINPGKHFFEYFERTFGKDNW